LAPCRSGMPRQHAFSPQRAPLCLKPSWHRKRGAAP
jgi:hypothetical protein